MLLVARAVIVNRVCVAVVPSGTPPPEDWLVSQPHDSGKEMTRGLMLMSTFLNSEDRELKLKKFDGQL
jgi:hypothetical protein